jgi:DNA polymerase beta
MNENIIKWFELLVKQLEFYVDTMSRKDKLIYSYKVNAINNALKVIRNLDFEITSGAQLKKYKGIGKGAIKRIDEILQTGKLAEVKQEDITGKHLDYVEQLMKIFGIGRVKAYELYSKYGIKSLSDLKAAIKKGEIELPENVMIGILYVDKIKTNIPRDEMHQIYSYLLFEGIEVDNDMDVRMCGSYRREKSTSNDIDIIISHPNIKTLTQATESNLLKNFIEHLKRKEFIIESLTSDDVATKYMGICRLSKDHDYRRIDIRCFAQESYYVALLYFTGSGDFNQRMRKVAKSMGYKLNEYFLIDEKDHKLPVTSEQDIFNYLNMEYVIPKDRI